jgi:hypothetical protein
MAKVSTRSYISERLNMKGSYGGVTQPVMVATRKTYVNARMQRFMLVLPSDYRSYLLMKFRQLGDLGILRGVIHGFSEEARTRGFPSPPFGGFGFAVVLS